MNYRRHYIKGGQYFFTLVSYRRCPILCKPESISLLRNVFKKIKYKHPFQINAIVVLPDHLHCIWTLPANDQNYSIRWKLIKSYFSYHCHRKHQTKQKIWQNRFWEHTIRDDKDYETHVDYIHYNPVKHGLVHSPKDWQYSSFHHFVQEGIYPVNRGENLKTNFDHIRAGE